MRRVSSGIGLLNSFAEVASFSFKQSMHAPIHFFSRRLLAAVVFMGTLIWLVEAADNRTTQNLFNGKDLAGWRQPAGEWKAVKSVSLDPQNEKQFVATPGTGVLL